MPNTTALALMITRRDGTEHTVLYDPCDVAVVAAHTWYLNKGYASHTLRKPDGTRTSLYLHRAILGLAPDDPAYVDHRNGNRLDNRRANLRATSNALNIANQQAINGRGRSRFRGVYWHEGRQRWAADARLNYRKHYLGLFDTEESAAAAVARFRADHGLPTDR